MLLRRPEGMSLSKAKDIRIAVRTLPSSIDSRRGGPQVREPLCKIRSFRTWPTGRTRNRSPQRVFRGRHTRILGKGSSQPFSALAKFHGIAISVRPRRPSVPEEPTIKRTGLTYDRQHRLPIPGKNKAARDQQCEAEPIWSVSSNQNTSSTVAPNHLASGSHQMN